MIPAAKAEINMLHEMKIPTADIDNRLDVLGFVREQSLEIVEIVSVLFRRGSRPRPGAVNGSCFVDPSHVGIQIVKGSMHLSAIVHDIDVGGDPVFEPDNAVGAVVPAQGTILVESKRGELMHQMGHDVRGGTDGRKRLVAAVQATEQRPGVLDRVLYPVGIDCEAARTVSAGNGPIKP
mmetsp:Transcript_57437/g.69109  ORF Transcript_57437/g.69109 Transcript_57437/m.69109 type:complete len:179 (-) Transcript_57437:182-718(-)